jgi:hypothetical protein
VELLRRLGVRSVVVHLDLAGVDLPSGGREVLRARPPDRIVRRSIRGLPVTREDLDGAVVYHLAPAPLGTRPPALSGAQP